MTAGLSDVQLSDGQMKFSKMRASESSSSPIYYLNGIVTTGEPPAVSVEDRGFFFGDGIYEVIRVYDGKPFCLPQHLERLQKSARAVELDLDAEPQRLSPTALTALISDLIRQGGFGDASIYLQLTRGQAPRNHVYPPKGTPPTLYITIKPTPRQPAEILQNGIRCITVEDLRWWRCDVKTLNLLYNVMARNKATEYGAYEAILYRVFPVMRRPHPSSKRTSAEDRLVQTPTECTFGLPEIRIAPVPINESRGNGCWGRMLGSQEKMLESQGNPLADHYTEVTEASSANIFAVVDGKLITHPADNLILHGVVRQTVIELCRRNGIEVVERPFGLAELARASEAFLTGTILEIAPVVNIDGKPVANGMPGPITLAVAHLYKESYERGFAF
ncbi:MAG TPA: hypothetical protein GX507_08250 [Clostridia bacterium]|nr:hypothetical protein [Clostridia bacterium]